MNLVVSAIYIKGKTQDMSTRDYRKRVVIERNLIIVHMLNQSMPIYLHEMTEKVEFVDERNLMIAYIAGQNIQRHLRNISEAVPNLRNLTE